MKSRIEADLRAAMKAGDKARLSVLRLILSEIKSAEINQRKTLSDNDILEVLGKMAKQRRESMKQFSAAGRSDLHEQEKFELSVISSYMPEPLNEAALAALIEQVIAELGATHIKDMSRVMVAIKKQAPHGTDLSVASRIVKARLAAAH